MNITKRKERDLSERDYRSLKDRLSYSSLKTFSKDRFKFYKEFVLGEKKEETLSNDMILGNLVDCELFTPEDFDNKFHINQVAKPTGQMGELCDELILKTIFYTNEDKEITVEFSHIFEESLATLQKKGNFKGKDLSKVLELFTKKDGDISPEDYYRDGRDAIGKTVVDINQVTYGKKLVEQVLNCRFEAGEILRQRSTDNVEVLNQFAILFEINGIEFKALIDKLIIDHINKRIEPFDLKVTWENESFDYNFLKMGYYIQNGVYNLAIREYVRQNPELAGYEIDYLSFITVDSSGKSEPLVYRTNEEIHNLSLNGFTTSSGKSYKGVLQLIDEIQHHLNEGNWLISKDNFLSNGVSQLKINV